MGLKFVGRRIWNHFKQFEKRFALSHPGRVGVGLGTTAVGVFGNEPVLSDREFEGDLKWARESMITEVFVFRLGGLTESQVSIIKEARLKTDTIKQ